MLKRIMDVVLALLLLIILAPLLVVLCLVVRFGLGAPIFFRQRRPGLYGQPFDLIKFRTMTDCKDEFGQLLSDEIRLTRLGRFLRATSLDELPELWNVLVGEMSLVGPRPLLMAYLPLYTEDQKQRHWVRPGITGWAQVNGRNALSWEDKFELDRWYVANRSIGLDIKILLLTVKKVIQREGIQSEGQATTERFMGVKTGS